MVKCPVCAREMATPFFLNVDAWRWLKCPHCATRLEKKNSRYLSALAAFVLVVISLGRLLGPRYNVLMYVLMAAIVLAMLVMLASPKVQVRKPLPEPETRLDINKEAEGKK